MTTQHNPGGRPAGSRNIRPSRAAIERYYRQLTTAADQGDVQAAGFLIRLHELRCSEQGEINGV